MLVTLLKILGFAVLLLLCLLAAVALLVLFFPVSYQLYGMREPERMEAWLKARWLFGIFRMDYRYPRPGVFRIKALWFTLYDSGVGKEPEGRRKKKKEGAGGRKTEAGEPLPDSDPGMAGKGERAATGDLPEATDQRAPEAAYTAAKLREGARDSTAFDGETFFGRIRRWLLEKYEKIKYTFSKICDKIKHILENYNYYRALMDEEDTRQLFVHAKKRLGKVWKNIRPRKIRANVCFGTGAPDTTGYLLGVCGMLSPFLGNHISVTPDFEEAVLNGDIYVAGHITAFVFLINGCKLLLDRRLKIFISKLKRAG